jgi:hypothetical protein
MPSRTPQHWRLVTSYGELMRDLESISSPQEKVSFLEFQIRSYQQVASSWRSTTDPISGNLPRDRVAEFAELLKCESDYQTVIDHAYTVLYHWPRHILPHAASLARSLTLLAEEASEKGYARDLSPVDLEQLTDVYFFNVRAIFTDTVLAASVRRRLAYLEELQRDLISLVTKGRLVITDPETGVELPPGDKTQRAFALEYIRSTLGPVIQECRKEIALEEAGKKNDHRYSYELEDLILWIESPRKLVRLLEILIEETLIRVPVSAIPTVIHNHFMDEARNRFYPSEIAMLLTQPVSGETAPWDHLIPWAGSEGLLAILVDQLDDCDYIDCPVDAKGHPRYGELIQKHLLNRKGDPFKRAQVHSAMQNVKDRKDILERVDTILNRVCDSA